jgi:hypothetical protein
MARDFYERHYAEKIWDRVPEMYRDADGRPSTLGDPGGRNQLRALVEVLAGQAAVLRRSTDRLWDDMFIDLCDDWAVPYLGDLVGTRMVSALDTRARRVDVASTVHYRRRAGTLRLLEQLVGDIAGWEGVVVENFRRLGRTWHSLDQAPSLTAGKVASSISDARSARCGRAAPSTSSRTPPTFGATAVATVGTRSRSWRSTCTVCRRCRSCRPA